MSFSSAPWETEAEPTQSNVRAWLDNLYTKVQSIESARWNQSNIDTLFYAGNQNFINDQFNFTSGNSANQFYFNLIQQPVNMVTGYQRQHRKSINYIPSEGSDTHTTDQYTRAIVHINNVEGINEQYSKGCELSAISGMVLAQPYLDYMGDDPAQGNMRLKIWEYNSFLVDPFFRNPDMSDCQYVWCQQYITRQEAKKRFKDRIKSNSMMSGYATTNAEFYFLPENYNMNRNDLMVLSYVWYQSKRMKKRLYSRSRNQFFDFAAGKEKLDEILYHIPDMQIVEVECPTWRVCIVLNDELIFQGENPLGFDECPFIPMFWNYDPHISQYDMRVRSLVTPMRSPQFLLNRRIILNHDISESSINSGWMRKVGAVANEDNLKKSGQGWDVLINEGYELSDCQKIIPNAVPASDMELANQLSEMIFSTSGINIENWSAQQDNQVAFSTVLLKQGANLMVLQKYFDQWDYALKLLGNLELKIILNNWNAAKVGLILGEEPSPYFYSSIFAKYQVVVEEGINTATQQQQEFQQLLELNTAVGGIIPPSYIVSKATIQGKKELMEMLQKAEMQQAAVSQNQTDLEHAFLEAQMKELYSRAVGNIAMARERYGRSESNIGLFEERLSNISENRSMATKNKIDALKTLIELVAQYGAPEVQMEENQIENITAREQTSVDNAKAEFDRENLANKFFSEIVKSPLQSGNDQNQMQQMQQPPQQAEQPMQTTGEQI